METISPFVFLSYPSTVFCDIIFQVAPSSLRNYIYTVDTLSTFWCSLNFVSNDKSLDLNISHKAFRLYYFLLSLMLFYIFPQICWLQVPLDIPDTTRTNSCSKVSNDCDFDGIFRLTIGFTLFFFYFLFHFCPQVNNVSCTEFVDFYGT